MHSFLSQLGVTCCHRAILFWQSGHQRWLWGEIMHSSSCRTILREATEHPTPCKELVNAWPDFVGVKDASKHGVGGVIVDEGKPCTPTVFRVEWPPFIKDILISETNPVGTITNSDLEMAGAFVAHYGGGVWAGDSITLCTFSDNSPTVHWVRRLAARGLLVAAQLIRALTLWLKFKAVSPLTPLHVEGKRNAMADVPSRSFGSKPKWFCDNDSDFCTMFNKMFPLPNQQSWTVFKISTDLFTRVLSILRMQAFKMDKWWRLPPSRKFVGDIGAPTRACGSGPLFTRTLPTRTSVDTLWDLQEQSSWLLQ
jgi:hypothetical protein